MTDSPLLRTADTLVEQLREALQAASDHLDYCGYGDSYEWEGARDSKLPERIEAALKRAADETPDIQHLMAALVDQEGVLNECETLLREALDDRGVNVGFDDRLIAYWAKSKALSDWRTRDLQLTLKAGEKP